MSTKWDLRHLVETEGPRANRPTVPLPPFTVVTRNKRIWAEVVEALRGEPNQTATYGRLLDLLGVRGDAQGSHEVRSALSAMISGSVPLAPKVERLARGVYQLHE